MKTIWIAGVWVTFTAAGAGAAELPVRLDATDLTLSRSESVAVDVRLADGQVVPVVFSRDEIASGTIEKTAPIEALEDVQTCTATWRFRPQWGDVLPEASGNPGDHGDHGDQNDHGGHGGHGGHDGHDDDGFLIVDNVGFDCNLNSSRGAIEITPLTMVQALRITIPATAFSRRDATAMTLRLAVMQEHGPAWSYSPREVGVDASAQDRVLDSTIFTGGCLSFEVQAGWSLTNGTSALDAPTRFIGEAYVVE